VEHTKEFIRHKMLHSRASLTEENRQLFSKSISDKFMTMESILKHSSFSCYVAINTEVATNIIIDALLTLEKLVYVPIVLSKTDMVFAPFDEDTQELSRDFKPGLLTKTETSLVPEVAIIPLVAASPFGDRIGYGKGYYDRWLSRNHKTKKIGLAFSCQLFENITSESHDQKLDKIITEEEIISCNNQDW